MTRIQVRRLEDFHAIELSRYVLSPGGAVHALGVSRQAIMESANYERGRILAWSYEPRIEPEPRWWRRLKRHRSQAMWIDFGSKDDYEAIAGLGFPQFGLHVDDWSRVEGGPEAILSRSREAYRHWRARLDAAGRARWGIE